MRTEREIRRRLQQRRFRHQKRYLTKMLERRHMNCRFNAKAEASHGVGGCVCTHPDIVRRETINVPINALIAKQSQVTLPACDAGPMRDRAPECDKFETKVTKERAKSDFKRILSEASTNMDQFAAMWPDMAQLIWVLQPGATQAPLEVMEDAEPPPEEDWETEAGKDQVENLELCAVPGTHLRIGEPVTAAKVPLEHAGYVGESTRDLAPRHDPSASGGPGWLVSILRWLLSKVEG